MNDNAFGIRDGEIAVELPAKFDASLYFIGRIRTPWTRREDCPKNARESDAVCTLNVDQRWAQALTGVETCTHLRSEERRVGKECRYRGRPGEYKKKETSKK